eukprot:8331913-Pyramimonas_sp.AAC.1
MLPSPVLRPSCLSRPTCQAEQFITLSGPDGTKIGSDCSIQIACVGSPSSMKMAICPPQAAGPKGGLR